MNTSALNLVRFRPIAGTSDLPAIQRLLQACEAVDQLDEFVSLAEMEADFLADEPGWTRSIGLWERADQVIAIAGIWAPDDREHSDNLFSWFNVHPAWRGAGMPETALRWLCSTAQTFAGPDTNLDLPTRDKARWRIEVALGAGFEVVRRFDRMKRDLRLPIQSLPLAAGYRIRTVHGDPDVASWVDAFNASFIDHFAFVRETVESRNLARSGPGYDPELDFVAVAPDGSIGAFCWCDRREPDGQPVEHWVHLLGTHRDHRRKGLASALLAHGLNALRERGATEARLSVDTESTTGATSLYERAGFVSYATTLVYRAPIAQLRD